MEWLASILNGGNIIPILIFVTLVLIGVYYVIKKGFIRFQAHGLAIGQTRENELRIVREQLQYMEKVVDAAVMKVPEALRTEKSNNVYKVKYWFSLLKDFWEVTVIYNHLTADETYIIMKSEAAYNIMLANVDNNEYWRSPEFRGFIYNMSRELIQSLVKVRETYQKDNNK